MKKNLLTMAVVLLLCTLLLGTTAFAADAYQLDLSKLDASTGTEWSYEGPDKLTLHSGTFALTGRNSAITRVYVEADAAVESTSETISVLYLENRGTISGGTFSEVDGIVNYGTISDGTFSDVDHFVNDGGDIISGTFSCSVENLNKTGATISGGTFTKRVSNYPTCTISGGTFSDVVYNEGSVTGGTFQGELQMARGGTLSGVTPDHLTYEVHAVCEEGSFGNNTYPAAGSAQMFTANIPTDKFFSHWEVEGLTGVDTTQPTISFNMPANCVRIEAVFKEVVAYNLWVGGVQMTDQYPYLPSNSGTPQATAPASGGYAYYDGTTLVLNNYSYTGPGYEAWTGCTMAIYSDGNLAIELVGTSSLLNTNGANGKDYAVYVKGTLSIDGKGSGVLYVGDNTDKGSNSFYGDISVKNSTLNIGTRGADVIAWSGKNNLSISGSTITGAANIGDESVNPNVYIADSTISGDVINSGDLLDVKNSVVTANELNSREGISVSDSVVNTMKLKVRGSDLTVVNSSVTVDGEPDEDEVFNIEGDVVLDRCKVVIASKNHDGSNPEEFKGIGHHYKYIKILPCNTVTVTAGSGGSAGASAAEACLDEVVTLTATPDAGYRFVKWESSDVTVADGKFTMPWKPVTVTAVFEDIPTITFSGVGADGISSVDVGADNKLASLPTPPARTGYIFKGWADAAGSLVTTNTVFTADTTLNAVWEAEKYTVKFESNGGSTVATQTVAYNTTATRPSAPSKTGHDFGGWYTDKDCTAAYDFTKAVTGNMTLYAKWTAKQYTVTFNVNGGKTPAPANQKVTFGKTYGTLPTASHSSLYFAGWYTAASGGDRVYASTVYKVAGNQTLYAHWSNVPLTGDGVSVVQVAGLVGLLTVSLAGLAAVLVYRKRRT